MKRMNEKIKEGKRKRKNEKVQREAKKKDGSVG